MHSQLRERIRLMRARLDNAAPVAEIRAESQLFVTPAPVCDRLVTLAEISNRDHILEPSAGTGAILRAIRDTAPGAMCDAVEINSGLVRYLRENFNGVRVQCGDFMEWQPVQYYSRIIMNPPFSHGQDIRDNEGRVFARQGEVMNPLQYVPFNQTLYFINGDDPAQVAWMKRQTPPTLESKIILVQGSIPEMQKSLDSRVYFDQNGVLCQRLGIDQVPARVSAVPGDRFLKVEFIPAEEGRK